MALAATGAVEDDARECELGGPCGGGAAGAGGAELGAADPARAPTPLAGRRRLPGGAARPGLRASAADAVRGAAAAAGGAARRQRRRLLHGRVGGDGAACVARRHAGVVGTRPRAQRALAQPLPTPPATRPRALPRLRASGDRRLRRAGGHVRASCACAVPRRRRVRFPAAPAGAAFRALFGVAARRPGGGHVRWSAGRRGAAPPSLATVDVRFARARAVGHRDGVHAVGTRLGRPTALRRDASSLQRHRQQYVEQSVRKFVAAHGALPRPLAQQDGAA